MSRRIILKRILTLSLALVLVAASTALAAASGRLELLLGYDDVTLSLYRVADYRVEAGSRKAELTESFKDSGADLGALWKDAAEMRRQAGILVNYAGEKHPAVYRTLEVQPYTEEGSQTAGRVVTEDLEEGVYLILKTGGDTHVTVTPFLITMPYLDEDSQEWTYNIKSYPKCGYDKDDGGGDDGGDGGGGGGRDRGSRSTSYTTITDGDVPLTSWIPDTTIIPDAPVPLAGLPRMGDAGIVGYLLGALAAAAAGGAAFRRRRRYKEEDNE